MEKILISCMALMLCFSACKKKDETKSDPSTSVDSQIGNLPDPIQPVASDTTSVGQTIEIPDGEYICTEKKYAIGYGFQNQIILNPQNGVIYPGALLDGNSVVSGAYTPITLPRAPITIAASLQNLNGKKSIVVNNPNNATVSQGVADLLDQGMNGSTAAAFTFEYSNVSSEAALDQSIGVSASAKVLYKSAGISADISTKIKSKYNYSSVTKKNKFLFRFVQSYYTMDVVPPNKPSEMFAPGVTTDDVKKAISSTTTPVYVSSVNYGRIIYFCIESDYSFAEVKREWEVNVSAKVKTTTVSGSGNVDIESSKNQSTILQSCNVSAVVLGGNASSAAKYLSDNPLSSITQFVKDGADFDPKTSPALPISYVLKKLNNGQTFKVVDYNQFTVRDCRKISGEVVVTSLNSAGGDNQIGAGTVRATFGYMVNNVFTPLANSTPTNIFFSPSKSDYDLNTTSKIDVDAKNINPFNFSVDATNRASAVVKLEFTGFMDDDNNKDRGNKNYDNDDYYANETKYYKVFNDPAQKDADGNYSVEMVATEDRYNEEFCTDKVAGVCIAKGSHTVTKSQNARFIIKFKIAAE